MESFPTNLLSHLAPLVVIQGLESQQNEPIQSIDKGDTLQRNLPIVDDSVPYVQDLIKVWRKYAIDEVVWDNHSIKSHISTHPHRYRFKYVGSSYHLPEFTDDSITKDFSNILSIDWLERFRSITPSVFITFYELQDKLDQEDELKLVNEINALKVQLSSRSIKLIVIIVSTKSVVLHPSLEDRVNSIRKQTSLNNRNGLLFLSSSKPKEVNAFALEVLTILKPATLEFYSLIEKRLRKERIRDLSNNDVLKDHIEVRFALKLGFINEFKQSYEYAIKSFETAYENLILVLNKLALTDPNWEHFRLLLNISIFHIVKLNFYLEQPNIGYKKFDVHLQSIVYFLRLKNIKPDSFQVLDTLSSQFKWLAQLSDLTPSSLIPIESPYFKGKDPLSPVVLPHTGFLYLQSVDLLQRAHSISEIENFDDNVINLLTFAKLSFQKKDNVFNRSIASTNYQLAEIYYGQSNFEKAFKLYEQVLDTLKEDDWNHLLSFVHYKLFLCSQHLSKHYATVLNLVELALIKDIATTIKEDVYKIIKDQEFKNSLIDHTTEEELILNASSNFDLFEGEALFQESEVSLTKKVKLQLKLSSKLNAIFDQVYLDNVLIELKGSIPSILLKHDDNGNDVIVSLDFDKDQDILIGSTNLKFKPDEEKIFKFDLETLKIGSATIVSITSILNYYDNFKVKLNIPLDSDPLKSRYIWYGDGEANNIQSVISAIDPLSTEIIPRIPDTVVKFDDSVKFAIKGESFPLEVSIIDEDKEPVSVNIEVETEGIRYHWNHNDQVKKLELASVDKNKETKHLLNVLIPNILPLDEKTIVVKTKVTFYINNNLEIPIVKRFKRTVTVIDPFKISISIFPRLKDVDLPSLFILKKNDQPLPKPSRYWLAKINVVDSSEEIEVVEDELTIETSNPHMVVREADFKKVGDNGFDHYIDTIIEDGHTYRNIQFESILKLRWKRKSSSIINTYTNEVWKLSLPLLDPRVLLEITFLDDKLVLKFMLENPTSRVFQFNITFIDNQHFQTIGINESKQINKLSILPMTRQALKYSVTPIDPNGQWLLLPSLKVFDVHYRVNLPTLLSFDDERVKTVKNDIYVNV